LFLYELSAYVNISAERKLILFFIVQASGLVLLEALTFILTDYFDVYYKISFFFASLVIAVLTFSGSKLIVFKKPIRG